MNTNMDRWQHFTKEEMDALYYALAQYRYNTRNLVLWEREHVTAHMLCNDITKSARQSRQTQKGQDK